MFRAFVTSIRAFSALGGVPLIVMTRFAGTIFAGGLSMVICAPESS